MHNVYNNVSQIVSIHMGKCNCCGEFYPLNKMNGVYSVYGERLYCKKKECQKRFIEDSGDINNSFID